MLETIGKDLADPDQVRTLGDLVIGQIESDQGFAGFPFGRRQALRVVEDAQRGMDPLGGQFGIVLDPNHQGSRVPVQGPPSRRGFAQRLFRRLRLPIEGQGGSSETGIDQAAVDRLRKIITAQTLGLFFEEFWSVDRILDPRRDLDPSRIEQKIGDRLGNDIDRAEFFSGNHTADHADRTNAGPRQLRLDVPFLDLKIEEIFNGQIETHFEAVEDVGRCLAVVENKQILD